MEARSHEEARQIICCCCSKKTKSAKKHNPVRVVNDRFSDLVRKHVFSEYSVENISHPTALCDSCRLALVAIEKVRHIFSLFKLYSLYFII